MVDHSTELLAFHVVESCKSCTKCDQLQSEPPTGVAIDGRFASRYQHVSHVDPQALAALLRGAGRLGA